MDRPRDSQKLPKRTAKRPPNRAEEPPKDSSEPEQYSLRVLYLILYNWLSAILWSALLGRLLLTSATRGWQDVYRFMGDYAKWTQTMAVAEIAHSLFGIVRAPLIPTILQVSSRLLLVWLIIDIFPQLARESLAYISMLVAWSVTEIIRYSYFTASLVSSGEVPAWLKWLRYNTFFVLYPLGIASECWLVCLATEPARKVHPFFEKCLWGVLLIYAPGAMVLFNHMMAQRRKVLRGQGKKKTK